MRRVLLVGAGGLGCPVGEVLARRGPESVPLSLTILDDDVVEETNLHRQPLYDLGDVGAPKAVCAAVRLAAFAESTRTPLSVTPRLERLRPDNAHALVSAHDLVIEGTDNLPSKFLAADAAFLCGRPIVHAGVVRWSGWIKGVVPGHGACLRCVFEDVPKDRVETCAEAGVVGALVGVVGALEAAIALRLMAGDVSAALGLTRIDARAGRARTSVVRPRKDCPLCGPGRSIRDLAMERYLPACATG